MLAADGAGLVAAVAASAGARPELETAAAASGAVVLVAAGLVSTALVPLGLVLVGGAYGVAVETGGEGVDAGAAVFAAGLFLAAELAHWAHELRSPSRGHWTVVARGAFRLALRTLTGFAAAAVVLSASAARIDGGLPLVALGPVALVGALALVASLARR